MGLHLSLTDFLGADNLWGFLIMKDLSISFKIIVMMHEAIL